MCGNNRIVCPALRTGRRYGRTNTFAAESNRIWVPLTIRPESGRTNPAIDRRIVVFPLPEGPKRTVHGWLRENFAFRGIPPRQCSICTVSRWAEELLDDIDPPSIGFAHPRQKKNRKQCHDRKANQHQRGSVRRRVVKLLHLVVQRNR